jgi:hypothetical protein
MPHIKVLAANDRTKRRKLDWLGMGRSV